MMELFDPEHKLRNYVESHFFPDDSVLSELYRYTYLNAVNPRMIAGPVQGKFLEMISRMINPKRILEIGTFTGYSSICLAKGLSKDGKLTTIEVNDELNHISRHFFKKAGLEEKIELRNGDALDIIPTLNCNFDLIYIDGEKEQYPEYYLACIEKLRPGGYLLADNALWDGKVIDGASQNDKSTKAIIAFNKMVQDDSRVDNLLLPFSDGIMMITKNV